MQAMAVLPREQQLCNGISPWLSPLAMVLTQDLVLPGFFAGITVLDRHNLPGSGPVLLAPTHRARWDALDRKSTRLNSSHIQKSRMPSSA